MITGCHSLLTIVLVRVGEHLLHQESKILKAYIPLGRTASLMD